MQFNEVLFNEGTMQSQLVHYKVHQNHVEKIIQGIHNPWSSMKLFNTQ